MVLDRMVGWLILVFLLTPAGASAQTAPKLLSVFPMGGKRGTTVEVEIRGASLEGSHAVWLGKGSKIDAGTNADGLGAQVKAVLDGSRVKVRLVMAANARVGFHSLSLISPGGLSGSIPFWVGADDVIQEKAEPHGTRETAQPVKLPTAVNGRISQTGQLAFYSFEIAKEKTVTFEIVALHGTGFDPQLALYEAAGSLLDPGRSKRLLFREEVTQGGMPVNRRMTYLFTKPGRYLVSIGNPLAQGGGDFSYLLRIAANDNRRPEDALTWGRRRFDEVRSRAVGVQPGELGLVKEGEPKKTFALPAVLEGTIGQPGDTDFYRFKAKAGQKIAFELQYPHAAPPQFNLRLDVLDAKQTVVLSNLLVKEGKVGTVDAKVIQIAPDLLGTLDKDGEYTLRIRDITSIHGSPDHVYRVLVRPQIPHAGDLQIQPEGPVNLRPGAPQRLTFNTPGKEGYAGTLALSVEGLPPGVKAFVSGSTIDLVADANAPGTPLPQIVRVSGLAIAGGNSSFPFPVAEIPVMVIRK